MQKIAPSAALSYGAALLLYGDGNPYDTVYKYVHVKRRWCFPRGLLMSLRASCDVDNPKALPSSHLEAKLADRPTRSVRSKSNPIPKVHRG